MFKNPLNAEKNIDELVAEMSKEDSDTKTVAKIYTKIIAKGAATGLLITTGLVAIGATIVVIAKSMTNDEEETEENEEDSETDSEE